MVRKLSSPESEEKLSKKKRKGKNLEDQESDDIMMDKNVVSDVVSKEKPSDNLKDVVPNEKPSENEKCSDGLKEVVPLYWFDYSTNMAYMQEVGGLPMSSTGYSSHATGFVEFEFPNSSRWLSEVPFLSYELQKASEIENAKKGKKRKKVNKRPAQAKRKKVNKRPAQAKLEPVAQAKPCLASTTTKREKKNEHSRKYHKAVCDYRRQCKVNGMTYDHELAKKYAREAAAT